MEGWVGLGYPAMHWPGFELAISWSQVRRPIPLHHRAQASTVTPSYSLTAWIWRKSPDPTSMNDEVILFWPFWAWPDGGDWKCKSTNIHLQDLENANVLVFHFSAPRFGLSFSKYRIFRALRFYHIPFNILYLNVCVFSRYCYFVVVRHFPVLQIHSNVPDVAILPPPEGIVIRRVCWLVGSFVR